MCSIIKELEHAHTQYCVNDIVKQHNIFKA